MKWLLRHVPVTAYSNWGPGACPRHLPSIELTETAIEEASNANSQMACAPNDPADQPQPALAIGAAATNQSGLSGLLQRLDGFMRLANLAAEVRGR